MVCLSEILFSLRAGLCKFLDRSALGAFPCYSHKIGLEISFVSTQNKVKRSKGESPAGKCTYSKLGV